MYIYGYILKLVANGRHYCNLAPLFLSKPLSILWFILLQEYSLKRINGCLLKEKGNVSKCKNPDFWFKWKSNSHPMGQKSRGLFSRMMLSSRELESLQPTNQPTVFSTPVFPSFFILWNWQPYVPVAQTSVCHEDPNTEGDSTSIWNSTEGDSTRRQHFHLE